MTVDAPMISVVIPCYNESENVAELHDRLSRALPAEGEVTAEFILVDDGSTDGTSRLLDEIAVRDPRTIVVHHDARSGQSRALWSGLDRARGDWVGHLDADLQNDPMDLPTMLASAERDLLDAVLGYRADRLDNASRRWASRFANTVRRFVLGDSIRDIGCSTRVVRREALEAIPLVPNLHRYLPALIESAGWRCIQVPVHHHERRHGVSKYSNWKRGLEGLRDLPRMVRLVHELKRTASHGAMRATRDTTEAHPAS